MNHDRQFWSASRFANRHGVAPSKVLQWAAWGWAPQPHQQAGGFKFDAAEIKAWEKAGCPRLQQTEDQ